MLFGAAIASAQIYTVSTVAGADRVLDGNPATSAPLRDPDALAVDAAGNVYVLDKADNRVRRIGAAGTISTYAGTGVPGYSGDRGKATAARIHSAEAIAVDSLGNLYIADTGNSRVRRVTLDGIVNTIAGTGSQGSSGDGGPATAAKLDPIALTLDTKGNLYISDLAGFRIRKVDTAGIITTIAGNGTPGYSGDNGPALSAQLGLVTDVAVDAAGNVYLADLTNERVRKVDAAGMITTIAGSGNYGTIGDGVPATSAVLLPDALAIDGSTLYLADLNRDVIRRVDLSTGLITTFAGTGSQGFSGDNGPPANASLNFPGALAVDSLHILYVADRFNRRVRKITLTTISTIAGTGNGDGGLATSAFLNFPEGVAAGPGNLLLIADTGNNSARVLNPGGSIRAIGDVRGTPLAVAADGVGNFYVTDDEPVILKISATGSTTAIAGTGTNGYSGDNGPATSANIGTPSGVAVDSAGNVYFTDSDASRIRKVTLATGVITTIAGSGNFQASGDGGQAIAAGLDPFDIALDRNNNLYVADRFNSRIRKIGPDGIISTVAGTGSAGLSGDGGLAVKAQLNSPAGLAVDGSGNIFVADTGNGRIRRISPSGLISTIAAQIAPFRLTVDSSGNIFFSDLPNDRVQKLTLRAVTNPVLSIVSGNNQTSTVQTQLASRLIIKVLDASGTPIPGMDVSYAVTPAGAAKFDPPSGITLLDGTASVAVTLGANVGPVTVTASVAGSAPVAFNVMAIAAASPTAPLIAEGGVASAGLSVPAVKVLAPNSITSIFGQRFAPAGTARQVSGDDLVDGRLPSNLAGVCVQIGGQPAPVLNVFPNQLNIQVPTLPPGETTVQVISNCGMAGEEKSNAVPVTIRAASPEFFYFQQNADGKNPIAAINAVSGMFVGAAAPAAVGDVLTLFATGFGATAPAFMAGELPTVSAQVVGSVIVTIGGVTLAPADILYAGATQNAGVYQLSIRVPAGVSGDAAVVATIGGSPSPSGGFVTVAP